MTLLDTNVLIYASDLDGPHGVDFCAADTMHAASHTDS